jgi:hypothetical protein
MNCETKKAQVFRFALQMVPQTKFGTGTGWKWFHNPV